MASFGERLKKLRLEKNITLDVLAEKIHSTKATLSRYENSKRTPNVDFAELVADFFDVSTDYLLGKDSERQQKHLSDNDKKYNFVIEKAKGGKISAEKLDKLIDALLDDK